MKDGNTSLDFYFDGKTKYEVELYRKIIDKLNSKGFHFKDTSQQGLPDLTDRINRLIAEVKKDDAEDGASQILHNIAKKELDFLYVCLADSQLFHVFKTPNYGTILTFARNIDPSLSKPSSHFSGKYIDDALVVLGKPLWQGFWQNTDDSITNILDEQLTIPFIAENLFGFHKIFGLYKIKTEDIISAFTDFTVNDVKITKNRIVIIRDKGDPVTIEFEGKMKHTHRWILKKLRIPNVKALEELRHVTDRLQTDTKRANRGAYYTEQFLSLKMGNQVLQHTKPDFIIEPFAGAGSLVLPFLSKGHTKGWVNDIDEDAYHMLSSDYGSYGYTVTNEDLVTMPMDKIRDIVAKSKNPLFITNPPFNSSSGMKGIKINYGDLGDRYGRGNQIYPTIGKVIEIMKRLRRGYLAFFSPMGLFCERYQYKKLMYQILNNFTFVEGFIWSGKNFNDVSGSKPIAFTIWKFGGSTDLEDVRFNCEDGTDIGFRRTLLLKQGWNCDNRKILKDEIVAQYNVKFADPLPKIICDTSYLLKKGGSELIPENVKIDLRLPIPSELVYGLWSTVVGSRAIIEPLLEFDNAYTHLPDFSKPETMEILAYTLLVAFIGNDYTNGKIGFIGPRKIFKFGDSDRLNKGAQYLKNTYGNLPVGDQTISDIFTDIKNDVDNKKVWKKEIKKEISQRLDKIGYWDYIPLPKKKKSNKATLEHWLCPII